MWLKHFTDAPACSQRYGEMAWRLVFGTFTVSVQACPRVSNAVRLTAMRLSGTFIASIICHRPPAPPHVYTSATCPSIMASQHGQGRALTLTREQR